MPKKQRKFADDGWAVWIDGEDASTIHINDWLNPKGKSYVDIAIHIRGIKSSKSLNVYVPFLVPKEEIEDVSLSFEDTKILQAIFSAACIVDYKKNQYTSEIAYNGKTVDIVHISTTSFETNTLSNGTLIRVDLQKLQPYLDNDEAYFIWRMSHKSLDAIFKPYVDMGNAMERLRDLITTPVVSEKYGYSIRINESRLLPEEITRIGVFHRQKLKKAVITISIDENYEDISVKIATPLASAKLLKLEVEAGKETVLVLDCGKQGIKKTDSISISFYEELEISYDVVRSDKKSFEAKACVEYYSGQYDILLNINKEKGNYTVKYEDSYNNGDSFERYNIKGSYSENGDCISFSINEIKNTYSWSDGSISEETYKIGCQITVDTKDNMPTPIKDFESLSDIKEGEFEKWLEKIDGIF